MSDSSRSHEPAPFGHIAARLRDALDGVNSAREDLLRTSRAITQCSGKAIRAIHRGELDAATELIAQARTGVRSTCAAREQHPALYFAGYVQDAHKEYVEAAAMLAIARGTDFPDPDALGVEPATYLNGMAEAASESRRMVLDLLRAGAFDRAETVLQVMDDIYYEVITVDLPDAVTAGLRRTTDALRPVLERTRGDLTLTITQRRLEQALGDAAAHAGDDGRPDAS